MGFASSWGEIENVCGSVPGVGGSCALVKNDVIVVWMWPLNVDTDAVKRACHDKLAHYMMPTHFQVCEEFPLSSAGKVNRKLIQTWAIKLNVGAGENEDDVVLSEAEKVVGIFGEVLGVEGVRLSSDFFDLGGHSLKVQILTAHLLAEFGVEFKTKELFEHRTPSAICAALSGKDASSRRARLRVIERNGSMTFPSSLVQERLAFIMSMNPENVSFNLPLNLMLEGSVDADKLVGAKKLR